MSDESRSKEQLVREVAQLRERVAELEAQGETLRRSEARFRALFENAPLGYQALDESGNFVELNETYCKLLGYSKEELIGRNFSELLHPDFREVFTQSFPEFKRIGYILGIEFEMIKKDGSEIIVSFDGQIGTKDDGGFKQTHCIVQDVTDRKRAEQKVRMFRDLLDRVHGPGRQARDVKERDLS